MSEELEWYADDSEVVLGIVLRDKIDDDFVDIIMGRDEGDRFTAFDVQASTETLEEARARVQGVTLQYRISIQQPHPEQGII